MPKKFTTFRQIFSYYSTLDFDKVIFGGTLKLMPFAVLGALIAITPAYFISELVNKQLKTLTLFGISSLVVFLYMRFFLMPYVKKKGKKKGIKTKKGFYPLRFEDFQLKKMDAYLARLNIIEEKVIQQLINRAYRKADDNQQSRTVFNTSLVVSLIIPFWALFLTWVFKNYVDMADNPFQKLIEVSKLVIAFILLVLMFSVLISRIHKSQILSQKNRYLNFASILEDILLSKNKKPTP